MSITANLKKTYYYFKKNGIVDTYYAIRERLYARTSPLYMAGYNYVPVSEEELQKQRTTVFDDAMKFSILVPMYETKPEFAHAMIDSVIAQTYPNWELILADASETDVVRNLVYGRAEESRIRYVRIKENKGISENTNEALQYATGAYIGLLDHDDLLTPDALYEMALAIKSAEKDNKSVAFVYSDEDKCDSEAKIYYEPHIKSGFNMDLLLSNNYICHFLVMKAELMKKVRFRKEYDGAQDYDLVLRAFLNKDPLDAILHVNKVLYHWRCHDLSTASNPQSKLYAYEAGRRAVVSALAAYLASMHGGENVFVKEDKIYVNNKMICVAHTKHNGFYRVEYGKGTAEDIFEVRKDIGIVAGPVQKNNKITGGIIEKDGKCPYAGLPAKFSGYMHKMALQQECECVDAANAKVRAELVEKLCNEITNNKKINRDLIRMFGGYIIFYDPRI